MVFRWPFKLFGLLAALSIHAQAQNTISRPQPIPEVLADRVSMAMRGLPASAEDRAKFAAGEINLEALVEQYSKDPKFQNVLTHFWLDQLKITNRISFTDTQITLPGAPNATSIAAQLRNRDQRNHPNIERVVYLNQPKDSSCVPRLQVFPTTNLPPSQNEYQNVKARTTNPNLSATERERAAITLGEFDERIEQYRRFEKVHNCACNTVVDVKPFWDSSLTLKACPSVISAIKVPDADKVPPPSPGELCGKNLENCNPYDSVISPISVNGFPAHLDMNPLPMPSGSYTALLAQAVTEEPGRLIAAIVAERSDFRKVLTDSRTRINGPVETFYQTRIGKALLAQLPPNTFKNSSNGGLTLGQPGSMNTSYKWVDRGPEHAGVLTTWAFHQFTNGYRAKANRVYEAFLCRRFVIPPGITESETHSNDLLVRQPCASCHVHLEPMGDFFKKWEIEGVNYAYTPARGSDGKFSVNNSWVSGTDPKGLGEIVGNDPRFAECTATRAFEFVMGRGPTDFEKKELITSIQNSFSQKIDFVSAIASVVASGSFFRGEQ